MKKITFLLLIFANSAFCQIALNLEQFATGFDNPVDIKNAGDSRLFVVEQSGGIKIVNEDGSVNTESFLQINVNDNGNEQGLLGLAFHPDYETNGFFYLNYINNNGDTRISRFQVSDNASMADPNSEVNLLTISQPFGNHNGGSMQFGPDGFLYIALGDGGSGGDPGNRAQDLSTLLGKILRIDVDNTQGNLNYAIPSTNPFVGDAEARDEIWAYGLRNPWKFSFDRELGDLWVADVGQNEIEEINRVAATSTGGENYGWRCYEGSDIFNNSGCPDESTLTFPIAEYTHDGNDIFKCSVTGGYVYRGSAIPTLVGTYIFADFCSDELALIDETNTIQYFGPFSGGFSSFGENVNGELFVAKLGEGTISRVVDTNLSLPDASRSDFTIFPNPSRDAVELEMNAFSKTTDLQIYDITGKMVIKKEINGTNTIISVAHLAEGFYLAHLSSSSQTIKLVVNRR